MPKDITKNDYENKDKKNKEFKDLHLSQQTLLNKLYDKSKELDCQIEDVRSILSNRLFLERLKEFKTKEIYSKAVGVGFGNALLRCVEAQLKIIAQSIINTQYPSYNDNGELRSSGFGYSCDAAPHLDYSKDTGKLKNFIRKIYQEQELDLNKEVRDAIWKNWAYLKESKFNQPEEINLKKI